MTPHVVPGRPGHSVPPHLEPLEVGAHAACRETDQRQPHEAGTPGAHQLPERTQDVRRPGLVSVQLVGDARQIRGPIASG